MSDLRHTVHPDRAGAEHERARALAAAGLVSSLSPADAAALASHLDACRECRQASLDYALQGQRIHALPPIELPRDAWPAFAARLDAEEARVAGERARKAGRSRAASQAHPLGGRADRVPGTLALAAAPAARGGHRATPVVASVGLGSMLALVATIALVASGLPQILVGPAATPFAVDPSSVAWVQRDADGRFLLQAAPVNSACPNSSTSCADFGSRPSTIVALDMQPASVFLARGGRDAIVVDVGAAGAGTEGGSIYAIQLPTPYPTFTGAGPGAGGGAAGAATAAPAAAPAAILAATAPSAPARATADAPGTASPLVVAGALASLRPTTAPVASFVNAGGPGASLPAAVPLPTAAITRAIAEDVVLVGGRAAYSPDGRWFAFSARPADASAGPDVYVWRVGDARSHAITSDHAAVFAGWVGDMLLVSSPDAAAVKAASEATAASAATAEKAESQGKGAATAKPKATSTPTPRPTATAKAAGSDAGATARPKKTPAPDATVDPDATRTPAPDPASSPTPSPMPGPATVPVSYLLDPETGESTAIDQPGLWLPSVDPTGTRIVGWLGTVRPDPATRSWRPAGGSLVVGSWATVLGDDAAAAAATDAVPDATASATPADAGGSPAPKESTGPTATRDPVDGAVPSPDAGGAAATPEPTLDPDAPATGAASATPADTSDPGVSTRPTAAPGTGEPESLGVPSLVGRLPATWQVRWDPSGTHLAIWVQGSLDPEVGSLTLVAFDPDGVAAPKALLSATPAKPGFAIGKTRIAWATPSVTAAGGRVRVLVWSGPAVGETGTAPISGLETLVEAD